MYTSFIRKILVVVLLGILLPSVTDTSFLHAQSYIVDSPFSNRIKAYEGEMIKDGDGVDHVRIEYDAPFVEIENGVEVKVVGRCVGHSSVGSQGDVKAIIEYDGKPYYTDAFLLQYSQSNPESVSDIFAADDFSPNSIVVGDKKDAWQQRFNRLDVHSAEGKFWYGYSVPILIAILMFVAFAFTVFPSKSVALSRTAVFVAPVIMLGALCLECVYMLRMGSQCVWWCNKDIVGLWGAVGRSIPFVLVMILQISFVGFYLGLFKRVTYVDVPAKWSFISLLIAIIPGFFVAAYAACWITGISPDADFVNDLTPEQWSGFIVKFLILYFIVFAIAPVIICCVRTRTLYGIALGLFFVIYGLATVVALILLILALLQLLWAIVIELLGGLIVLGVILFAGSHGSDGSGGGTNQTYFVDEGGNHYVSGGKGRRMVSK